MSCAMRMGSAPACDQFPRQGEGGGAHRAVEETAGIGEQRGVEAGGHLRRDGAAGGLDKPVDQLADAGGLAIDPVEMTPRAAAGVVIDVDDRESFEAAQPRALQAVAFQQNGRVVGAVDAQRGADARPRAACDRRRECGRR